MDLYQVCSNYVPGVKTGPAPGVTSLSIGTKKENFKYLLLGNLRRRALIFGMWHLLVDLYQVCSNDAPGVKTGPAPGVTSLKHSNKQGKL